jgi:hypothetical protein
LLRINHILFLKTRKGWKLRFPAYFSWKYAIGAKRAPAAPFGPPGGGKRSPQAVFPGGIPLESKDRGDCNRT